MAKNPALVEYLSTRRSVPIAFLQEPGPTKDQLNQILSIGMRVPDHGKLCPWRLVLIMHEGRQQAGEKLAQIALANDPDLSAEQLEKERTQFLPAPVTIGVLSTPVEHKKVNEFEQILSAGNVAFNLVHGANALGFGAHWVTRWFSYDPQAAAMLGAREGEKFVGFVHIGTPDTRLEDKPKPALEKHVSMWAS